MDSDALEQHSIQRHRKSAKPKRRARYGTPKTGQPSSVMRVHESTVTLLSVTDSLSAIALGKTHLGALSVLPYILS